MNRFTFLGGSVIAVAAIAGCYTASVPDEEARASVPAQTVDGTEPASAPADLPCDVAAVLSTSCSLCHGAPPSGGAPNRLLSYDDLAAPSQIDPSTSQAQQCLERMKNAKKPMPPAAVLDAKEVGVIEAWLQSGMPKGTCSVAPPFPIDYDVAPVCSSAKQWTSKDRGSSEMHPGVACVECHKKANKRSALIYSIAGTVFPTAHEPDDCYGSRGVTIVITDAKAKTYRLPVNKAGNFMLETAITPPYRAKLVRGDQEIPMQSAQTDGDCNACHTVNGKEDARGRIVFPM